MIIEVEKFIFEHNNTSSAGEKLMTDLTTDYLSKLDFDHSVLPLYFFRSAPAAHLLLDFGTDAPPMRFHQDLC